MLHITLQHRLNDVAGIIVDECYMTNNANITIFVPLSYTEEEKNFQNKQNRHSAPIYNHNRLTLLKWNENQNDLKLHFMFS